MGGRAVACLNARDRNLLGFERDLLTAAAYGVDQFLFVYGDKPTTGGRTSELTVRSMIEHARRAAAAAPFAEARAFRVGATTGLRPVPGWKRDADFLCAQVSFSLDRLLAWRETVDADIAVYAGVMVLASAGMARRLAVERPRHRGARRPGRRGRGRPRRGRGSGPRAAGGHRGQRRLRRGAPGAGRSLPPGGGPFGVAGSLTCDQMVTYLAGVDDVFRALADPTRRELLDELFRQDGQTLSALEEHFSMSRFGVMKHLRLLEDAGLVVTLRRGREKLHYLNPVPIRLVHDRWVSKYAEPLAAGLVDLKHNLESTMEKVFEIYIRTTPERLWAAITDPDTRTKFHYGNRIESDWRRGRATS